ncbi:MAG: DUF5610 domain-containing protein [Pseudomonadota bacterium]
MSIPVSISHGKSAAAPGHDPDHHKVKDQEHGNKVKDVDSPASATAKLHASLNSSIVQTSLTVAITTGNDPLALLLKAAIEGVNDALKPTFGPNAIQNAAANQDNSAEATADRIVQQSTAFYDQYRTKNKLEDNAETRGKFIDLIQGGFEKGFKEAQNVLSGLKVLEGDIAAGIDKTHELVLAGYAAFRAGPMTAPAPTPDPQPTPAPAQPTT